MTERRVEFVVERNLPYMDGVAMQRRILSEMAENPLRHGTIILAEHRPVITRGRSGDGSSLLVSPERLAERGIEFHLSGRGGDVTYHGPGQWTVYPVLRLEWFNRDLRRYLRLLEECVIVFLDGFGVAGTRRPGLTGVWVGEDKVAAIGVAVNRWIAWHGFALNVAPDLANFTRFMHPCGIAADRGGVASLESLTGRRYGLEEVEPALRRAIVRTMRLEMAD